MVFTREDILKILNALLQLGRKDSEFKDANTPLNSDDYIAILLDGINKKVSINNLLSTLGLLKKDDFINVSDRYDEYYLLLSEAITIIANNKRKKGLVITFLDTNGTWKIYQFNDEISNFIKTEYWKDLFDFKYPIINTILPDEEDLTLTYPNTEGNSFIKLKDKEYDLENFSGMATKILRKNIKEINGEKKNTLTQDDFDKENCIYEIKYDFDLNNLTINIPNNCILEFNGGSLSNGIIGLNNVKIIGNAKIFCTFIGKVNGDAYIDWCLSANTIDETNIKYIESLINSSSLLLFSLQAYNIKHYINVILNNDIVINGNNTILRGVFENLSLYNKAFDIVSNNLYNVKITNINFDNFIYGILFNNAYNNIELTNCTFKCIECGVLLNSDITTLVVDNIKFNSVENGIYLSTQTLNYAIISNIVGINIRRSDIIPDEWRTLNIKPFKNYDVSAITISNHLIETPSQIEVNNIIIDGIDVKDYLFTEPEFHGISIKLANVLGNDINANNISVRNYTGNSVVLNNNEGCEGILLRGYSINANNLQLFNAGSLEGTIYLKGSSYINLLNSIIECSDDYKNNITTIAGIMAVSDYTNISNCKFINLHRGIYTRCLNLLINNCSFKNCLYPIFDGCTENLTSIKLINSNIENATHVVSLATTYPTDKKPILIFKNCNFLDVLELIHNYTFDKFYLEDSSIIETSEKPTNHIIVASKSSFSVVFVVNNRINLFSDLNRALITTQTRADTIIVRGNTLISGNLIKYYHDLSVVSNKLLVYDNVILSGNIIVLESDLNIRKSRYIHYHNYNYDYIPNNIIGTTLERPQEAISLGALYYDTTLNKPIWWNGTNWIDSTGLTI